MFSLCAGVVVVILCHVLVVLTVVLVMLCHALVVCRGRGCHTLSFSLLCYLFWLCYRCLHWQIRYAWARVHLWVSGPGVSRAPGLYGCGPGGPIRSSSRISSGVAMFSPPTGSWKGGPCGNYICNPVATRLQPVCNPFATLLQPSLSQIWPGDAFCEGFSYQSTDFAEIGKNNEKHFIQHFPYHTNHPMDIPKNDLVDLPPVQLVINRL